MLYAFQPFSFSFPPSRRPYINATPFEEPFLTPTYVKSHLPFTQHFSVPLYHILHSKLIMQLKCPPLNCWRPTVSKSHLPIPQIAWPNAFSIISAQKIIMYSSVICWMPALCHALNCTPGKQWPMKQRARMNMWPYQILKAKIVPSIVCSMCTFGHYSVL